MVVVAVGEIAFLPGFLAAKFEDILAATESP
jgi:hypothetical protein